MPMEGGIVLIEHHKHHPEMPLQNSETKFTHIETQDDPLLPFEMKSKAGFILPTEIKQSTKKGAGLGRFIQVPVKKGWVIRADPIVSVDYFLNKLGGVNLDYSVCVHLANKDDITTLEEVWTGTKALSSEVSKEDDSRLVREQMSWYMASIASHRTDTGTPLPCILSHSFVSNYGGNEPGANNYATFVVNGMLFHQAVRDIEAGEELFLDYADMEIPTFMSEWCLERGLIDVGTLANNIDGSA